MELKYPAKDALTGRQLDAGTEVCGVKVGGRWDFTAEPVDTKTFRKLTEAMLLSLEDVPDLDHEDYTLLAAFGQRYERVASMIGCDVPGLDSE